MFTRRKLKLKFCDFRKYETIRINFQCSLSPGRLFDDNVGGDAGVFPEIQRRIVTNETNRV